MATYGVDRSQERCSGGAGTDRIADIGHGTDRSRRARTSRHPPPLRRHTDAPSTDAPPQLAATSVTSDPANTARTASNRCSTIDKATSANPGLPRVPTPCGDVGPREPKPTTVADHLADACRTSAHGGQAGDSPRCRISLFWIKAPRSARRGR